MSDSSIINNRRGSWIQTYTQKQFYPLDPRPDDICIEDIAHALSNQCRFAGHTKIFYSVAEHAVHVARLCSSEYALWGLLHDASEAYLMDIPSPFKYLPEMSTYRTFEAATQFIIYLKYGLYGSEPSAVKVADKQMLAYEAVNLLAQPLLPGWEKWIVDVKVPEINDNVGWLPVRAKMEFLQTFYTLTKPA